MKATAAQARDMLRGYWPWITVALLIIAGLIHAWVTGTFQIAPEPPGGFKNIIKPSDANYPKLNPLPQRVVTISGTMPGNLPIQLIAVYWTTTPNPELPNHERCFRPGFLTPGRPLFIAHPLPLVKANGKYEVKVTVDKYEPGYCRWQLQTVVYVLGDQGSRVGNDIFDSGVYPPTIVFGEPTPSFPFRGPLNVWCGKRPDWEFCSTWGGVARNQLTEDVPADERNNQSQTLLTSDMSTTVVNFHDFDALPVKATAAPEVFPSNR
jgi:hypothetical protein